MSEQTKRKINIRNKTPTGRRLWVGKGEHFDIPNKTAITIDIDSQIIVSSIIDYNKLINQKGIGPEGHLVYNSQIFDIEEHSENTISDPKPEKKKVKRVTK